MWLRCAPYRWTRPPVSQERCSNEARLQFLPPPLQPFHSRRRRCRCKEEEAKRRKQNIISSLKQKETRRKGKKRTGGEQLRTILSTLSLIHQFLQRKKKERKKEGKKERATYAYRFVCCQHRSRFLQVCDMLGKTTLKCENSYPQCHGSTLFYARCLCKKTAKLPPSKLKSCKEK